MLLEGYIVPPAYTGSSHTRRGKETDFRLPPVAAPPAPVAAIAESLRPASYSRPLTDEKASAPSRQEYFFSRFRSGREAPRFSTAHRNPSAASPTKTSPAFPPSPPSSCFRATPCS